MERVAGPLRTMGASISLIDGRAPIRIRGNGPLSPVTHALAVPSAQVKTALILAALTASGPSVIMEPSPSRDHTERMLGLTIGEDSGIRTITVSPHDQIPASEFRIPGDFSSAAFFIVGASIAPEADLTISGVGVNPTRTGLLEVLLNSGAAIECHTETSGAEPTADIRIQSSKLGSLTVLPEIVPRLVDEVPVLAVAATQAVGVSVFSGIGELRAKESDRIETTTLALTQLGGIVHSSSDGMTVRGPTRLTGCSMDSSGDHRIAMAIAISGLVAQGETTIVDAESASVSYPGFWDDLESISLR
jgi:3-phosphoshikimate 1-carboxyvinyltransferase